MAFVYVRPLSGGEWLPLPYPSMDSGLQQISTIVDSARSADGVVRGVKVGRDQSKVNLTWPKLSCEEWSTILSFFNDNFMFQLRYMDMVTNDWKVRKCYVGDREGQPLLIDPNTNKPRWYLNCKANVIDTGEGD